ncbi:TIGR02206 family membrane protein [Bacillus dakarensis]|uniref:YwaF family protein n=1 Tax=Robertmurraya dakarensis TaxID=1926278 RepID=UPI0009813071|nr:TIGR02206 family membrane protein [Bacillus dakarensis]
MEKYFQAYGSEGFVLFSLTHLLTIIFLLLLVVIMFLSRKFLRETKANTIFRIGLASILILSEIALHIWWWGYDFWDIRHSLPLHLSSISLLLSAGLLITKDFRIFEFTYFAGLGSAIQAMITPDISAYSFPHFRYVHFFISHGGIVLANLFFVLVEQYRPRFKSLLKAFLYLNLYAFIVFLVNLILSGNYMYISKKPVNPSIMDYLGPWPFYIIPLEIIAFITFMILYLPFGLKKFFNKRIRTRG